MGRNAGWIAVHAGVAGGADVILIPEIPYELDRVAACIAGRERFGARFSIVVVAEGAMARGARSRWSSRRGRGGSLGLAVLVRGWR